MSTTVSEHTAGIEIDLLVSGGDVVTMNDRREVLVGGAVAIARDRIVGVGRTSDVLRAYPSGGRVEGWVTLVGHSLASDELLAGAAELARRAGVGMTMHMSPTSSDPEVYLERTGRRPLVHLAHLGVLGPHLLLAH